MQRLKWIVVAAGMFAFTGCGGSVGDYCEQWAKCEGGNDLDEDACVEKRTGEASVADVYDCGDEWDARMDCLAENSTCDSEKDKLESGDACDSEKDKLDACIDAGSAENP